MRWRWAVALLTAGVPIAAQDVFIGGRVDAELVADRSTRFELGREAGIDLTFTQPGVLEAYFDLCVAGGRARVQELYLSPPQTKRVVTVKVGRFLLPYGDPRTDPVDRYVDGAPDLFNPYRDWRTGNVFLDLDATGVALARTFGPVSLDLVGASSPNEDLLGAGRAMLAHGDWRGGASLFFGSDRTGAALRQVALHGAYRGRRCEVSGQFFTGEAGTGDHRGWLARASYRLPNLPLSLFVAQTLYNDDTRTAVSATRLGGWYKFDQHYRAEARYEFIQAPAPNGDNRFVARVTAVF